MQLKIKHRLFWKLFFIYWLALFIFSAGAVFSMGFYIEHTRAQHAAAPPHEEYRAHLESAQEAAAGGLNGLAAWARSVDEDELVPWLLLDRAKHDVLHRDVSASVLARLRRYQNTEPRDTNSGSDPPLHHRDVITPDGSRYKLIPDYQNASLTRLVARPKVLAMPAALAIVIGGILSLWLARYLANPIERLRHATRAYAKGDFSQRVGPTLGKREDEIVDLAYALDDMAERLDALLSAQRNLLRDVSHELRSPLARVQAALGLACQSGHGPEKALARIEHEMDRLNEMIGTILSMSRLESGTEVPRNEVFDLFDMLIGIAEDARIESAALGAQILLEGELHASFQGNPELIHSAFENIVRNAVRHSGAGDAITIHVAQEADPQGRTMHVIRVSDEGPGVPEDMLEKIFEPFVTANSARASEGVGLGLSIARRAIVAHAGKMYAENIAGGGLVVTIMLPVAC